MKQIKFAKIVEDYALTQEKPEVNKFQVIEAVKNYSRVGKQLYNNNNIIEVAKQLAQVAEAAQNHVLSETDDWFDGVSIKRNMTELKGLTGQFKKTALEANNVNQRLSALYEDMGNILNRYYDIEEGLDPVAEEKGDKEEYQKFFMATLKKFGVSEPDKLPDDKKKQFYNYIDANWKGDNESD